MKKACVFLLLASFAATMIQFSPAQVAERPDQSPKGMWGRVTPIGDNNHPNLYYNQSEVDELRNMILVKRSPQHLYDLYNSRFKDVFAHTAVTDSQNWGSYWYGVNMRAAISYMIEPTSEKADAIRTSLLSFESTFPKGLPDWNAEIGAFFAGYAVPWMFDLLMAYHPEKLSSAEITSLKNWFALSAERLQFVGNRSPGSNVYNGQGLLWTDGTKTIQNLPNWFSRYMGPSLAFALVSGNQADVDFWADSGWPHDLFRTEAVTETYPAPGTNRFDLVTYLLSVFPSGANSDTYSREGFRLPERTWHTTDYSWGLYHFAQMYGPILGAEMAYHNGMSGVFGITDVPGMEPALLRSYKRAIQSRTEIDRDPFNPTGRPIIGWDPAIFAGYRRYSDATVENAIPGIVSYSGPAAPGAGDSYRGYDVPGDVWQFFGYPRRIAWTAGGGGPPTLPIVTSVSIGSPVVPAAASFSVQFSGSNLNDQTYFDLRFRAPQESVDLEALNWQRGTSGSHRLPVGAPFGTWTITGVRPHQDENDHSASFNAASATVTVVPFF